MLPSTLAAQAHMPPEVKKELDWTKDIKRGARAMPAQRVQEHLKLNGFPVDIDADFGPATEKRVGEFQAAKGLPATGVVDFATWEKLVDPIVRALKPIKANGRSLSELTLAYALQHVAQHPTEAGGDNKGPWVRCYLGWDGHYARWCAGFTCFALEQAAATLGVNPPIASSSSCDTLAVAAKQARKFIPEASVKNGSFARAGLKPGSFFLVRKTPTDWTHVGIVSHADQATFDTVEGNTDSAGSSNGFEAAQRVRGYGGKDFIVW